MAGMQEIYTPIPLAASGGAVCQGIGGFFCTTSGTLQVTAGSTPGGAVIVDAFAVAVGVYYPLPFACPPGCYFVLTGGAKGTAGVAQ